MATNNWLSELYLAHRRLLLLVAWNITGDRDAAEDVLHIAMVRLALLDAAPVVAKSFAMKVVRNAAIDHVRFVQRRREERLITEVPSAAECVDRVDESLNDALQAALKQLEPEDAETVRLHLQGELTFREIGELLEQPLQTVASRYRRAIGKLRTMMESQHDLK